MLTCPLLRIGLITPEFGIQTVHLADDYVISKRVLTGTYLAVKFTH